MKINGRLIGDGYSPYIVAELSANHNGSLENAIKIIEMAKNSGADAIKMQTYTPDTITINSNKSDFIINDGLWSGRSLYNLYKEAHTPWEWHKTLFDYAKKLDITCFSSPFDKTAVDFLEDLNVPAYKVASFEMIDLPLVKYIAETGKPMIISTGLAKYEEIAEVIETAKDNGCNDLAVLHCVSSYPAPSEEYNLKTIVDIRENFDVVVGLSDHTQSDVVSIASVALGASIIEKHVTLDKNGLGPDDSFSLDGADLKQLCDNIRITFSSIGNVNYDKKESEKPNLKFRRSLYFVRDISKGELITKDVVKSIRPGYGVLPKYIEEVIGKVVICDIKKGTPVNFDLIR